MIQAGEPADLIGLLDRLKGKAKPRETKAALRWIHPRSLAITETGICWWRPAARTTMYHLKGVKPVQVEAWVPAMVMVAAPKEQFRCWLLAKNERPTAETMLYLPGWTNTYGDGGVCMGHGRDGSRIPTTNTPEDWEDAFFASSFSGPNNIHTSEYEVAKACKEYTTLGAALSARGDTSD